MQKNQAVEQKSKLVDETVYLPKLNGETKILNDEDFKIVSKCFIISAAYYIGIF